MERLATGEEVGARATGRGLCGSIAGKLGKGDGETGEDREDESLKNKKYVVRSSSQKERKKEIEDGATGDCEGVGATTTTVWVHHRERETGRQGRKKMRERKNIFIFKFYVF